jgi:hypothetical protein
MKMKENLLSCLGAIIMATTGAGLCAGEQTNLVIHNPTAVAHYLRSSPAANQGAIFVVTRNDQGRTLRSYEPTGAAEVIEVPAGSTVTIDCREEGGLTSRQFMGGAVGCDDIEEWALWYSTRDGGQRNAVCPDGMFCPRKSGDKTFDLGDKIGFLGSASSFLGCTIL